MVQVPVSQMPAISIITGSSWKAAKFTGTEQTSQRAGRSFQVRAKAHLWTLQGNLLPLQHFSCFCGQALIQTALKKCNSTKIWGPGTWNIRSLFNRDHFVRYAQDNNLSTTQLLLCQNRVAQVHKFFLMWPWIASSSVILVYTKNLNTDVNHRTFQARFSDVLVGICNTLGQIYSFPWPTLKIFKCLKYYCFHSYANGYKQCSKSTHYKA